MNQKITRGIIAGLAVLTFGLIVGGQQISAQAASKSKSVTLPKSYRGKWYLYGGMDTISNKKAPVFSYARLNLATKKITFGVYTTNTPDLKEPVWQLSYVAPLTYVKKVTKAHKVKYRAVLRITSGDPALTLSRTKVKVKVLGKKVKALRIHVAGETAYAFRQPLRSHAISDLLS